MKGIILAAGEGTRLLPLTKHTHKALIPVGREPMILHGINKLTEAGITNICIVTTPEYIGQIGQLLGSGKDYYCNVSYKIQDKAEGVIPALRLTEDFLGHHPCAVLLVDNLFEDSLEPYVTEFYRSPYGARVFLKKVADPTSFGVAQIKRNQIISLVEKPTRPKSNLAVTGIYLYDSMLFSYLKRYNINNITDINNIYLQKDKLEYTMLKGWWEDAGTFESLELANKALQRRYWRTE